MLINIGVCDDNIAVTRSLCRILSDDIHWGTHKIHVDEYSDGKTLVDKIRNGNVYDIIFLDVNLENDYLGTDTGGFIKVFAPNVLIVYMSSYDSYYTKVVHAEPFDFISKPFDQVKLQYVVNNAIRRLNYNHSEYMYTYQANHLENHINLKTVWYFESHHRTVIIHHDNGIGQFYAKLDDVEKDIKDICDFFIRCSQSYLVNILHVKQIGTNQMIMCDDQIVAISRKYKQDVMFAMSEYM